MTDQKDPTQDRHDELEGWPQSAAIRQSLGSFLEADLQAFIDDELDDEQQQLLIAKLADHPELKCLIDNLQADRRRLHSCAVTPMPVGMEADVQKTLARPMLVSSPASSPGTYRRQINRQARRARLMRAVSGIAAVIVVVVGAIILVIAMSKEVSEAPQNEQPRLTAIDVEPLQPHPIRTLLPDNKSEPLTDRLTMAPNKMPEQSRSESWKLNSEPVPFALVLSESTEQEAVSVLLETRRHLAQDHGMVTVVRNFSRREATELQQELLAANTPGPAGPMLGTFANSDLSDVPSRWSDEAERGSSVDRPVHGQRSSMAPSGVLSGPSNLAPDYNIQLLYSESGADYTVAIRLCDIDKLLQELALVPPVSTRLEAIDDEAPESRLEEMAWIREWINQRDDVGDMTVIHLPVIIEVADSTD